MTTLLEKAGQSIQTLRTRSAEQLNRTLMKVIQQRTNTIIQNICRCGLVNESTIKIHCFEEVETSFLGEEPHVINSWIQAILHCWRHMSRPMAFRKQLKQVCQEQRTQRIADATNQASRAATAHDSRSLYEAVRRLTPKQARKAIRFRDTHGHLMLNWTPSRCTLVGRFKLIHRRPR